MDPKATITRLIQSSKITIEEKLELLLLSKTNIDSMKHKLEEYGARRAMVLSATKEEVRAWINDKATSIINGTTIFLLGIIMIASSFILLNIGLNVTINTGIILGALATLGQYVREQIIKKFTIMLQNDLPLGIFDRFMLWWIGARGMVEAKV